MKKLIITIAALLLLGASIYAVNNFNKNQQVAEESASSGANAGQEAEVSNGTSENQGEVSSDKGEEGSSEEADASEEKTLAWDFTFENLEGNKVSLSDYRGKKVFLNFWASWCGPCRLEMPDIEKLHKELNPEEAVILAVNIGEDRSTVSKFLRDNNLTFATALDVFSASPSKYNLRGIPTTFIIDEEGYILSQYSGYMQLSTMREAMGL